MKKLIALLTICSMAFTFAACGGEPTVVEPESTSTSTAESTSAEPEAESEAEPEAEAGVAADHTVEAIKARGKIIIATESQYAPFAFKDMDGKIVGFEPTFMQAVADDLGVELEIMDLEFTAVIPSVQAGASDFAMAGFSPTPERAESVYLSDVYYGGGQCLVVLADEVDNYETPADFAGMTISCQKGALQQTIGEEQFTESKLSLLPKVPQCVQELKAGNVKGVLMDAISGAMYVKENPDLAISKVEVSLGETSEGSAAAIMKGNDDLLAFINEEIAKYIASGEMQQWFDEASAQAEELGL